MAKIFEKKIIIGSVFGILTTILGTTAIFFPDLFNLQKNRIKEYTCELKNYNDAVNLFEFLDKNKDKIVTLTINYREENVYGERMERTRTPYDSEWFDKFLENKKEDFFMGSSEQKYGISYSSFGENKSFFVMSEQEYANPFKRYNGGFGIWFGDRLGENQCKLDSEGIGEDCKIKLAYSVKFPGKISSDLLMKWTYSNDEEINWSSPKMTLSGTFYVKLLESSSETYPQFWSHEYLKLYRHEEFGYLGDRPTFELKPLEKKELAIRNY